jgi:hypothetical protein
MFPKRCWILDAGFQFSQHPASSSLAYFHQFFHLLGFSDDNQQIARADARVGRRLVNHLAVFVPDGDNK